MDKAQERDWSKWVPAGQLADTGPKKLATGQVWAYGSPWGMRGVFRVESGHGEDADVAAMTKWIAGNAVQPGENFSQFGAVKYAVLVQDVGQSEPTPPEGEHPKVPTHARPKHEVSNDGVNWIHVADDPGDEFHGWHRLDGLVDRQPPLHAAMPEPFAPVKRHVSSNGRDFVDYDSLVDPDPFESYRWRNLLTADGGVTHWYPDAYAGAVQREQQWAMHLHGEQEVAFKMRCRDVARMPASEKTEPEREPSRGCAPMLFGGIVRLR